jgi:hypothetical protein
MSLNLSRSGKSLKRSNLTAFVLESLKIIFIIFSILLTAGLIKPWRVLWFLPVKSRLYVLIVYGIPWLVILALLILLPLF